MKKINFKLILGTIMFFIIGIILALLLEENYRKFIRFLLQYFSENNIQFYGKNFHLFPSELYIYSSGLFFAILFLLIFKYLKINVLKNVLIVVLIFILSNFLTMFCESNAMNGCNENRVLKLHYNELFYDEYLIISFIITSIYLIVSIFFSKKNTQTSGAGLSFILSGGGTGGHIYPAIAIANELKNRFPDAKFLFVGASDKMEMQKVPQAGYEIKGLWIAGLQRKLTLQNALFPVKLICSLWKSYWIIKKFKPNAVIGTGGFASGPLLQMANMMGIPTVIQEQNSYPGITNKLLSKKANKICVAYQGLDRFFPKQKMILTGNPVRQDLLEIESKRAEGIEYFKLDTTKNTLLILGGSLGARRINQLIEKELDFLIKNNIQIIWQCGKLYYEEYKELSVVGCQLSENPTTHNPQPTTVLAFIDRMDLAYAAADFVISRAGASSVSELCLVGKPVIFIPSPNVAEDHQTKNAQAVVNKNGAIMLKENELEEKFENVFSNLINDENHQNEISKNIKSLALSDATGDIVDEIVKIIDERWIDNRLQDDDEFKDFDITLLDGIEDE